MKGLTHFISGIASATFIPEVVERSASAGRLPHGESSFLLALAGLYAIMPDTLDFKLGRFLTAADIEINSDSTKPDPQGMAEKLGAAMDDAWKTGREIRVQFHTERLSVDSWRRYRIHFDTINQSVEIQLGEIVTTSQVPFPGTTPKNHRGVYRLKHARLQKNSTRDTTVDIMSGPMYGFHRSGDYLTVDFLPWHRTWSHSYTLGFFLASLLLIPALYFQWSDPYLYPLVAFVGFATHITEDLTGHMGGSLIWPFIRRRTRGLCLFHAANPDANFITDYIAIVLIIFNLDRFGPDLITLSPPVFFLITLICPIMLYFLPRILKQKHHVEVEQLADLLDEPKKAPSRVRGIEELENESESIVQ